MSSFTFSKISASLTTHVLPFLGICAWLIFGVWISSLLSRLLYTGLSRTLGVDKARGISKGFKLLLIMLFAASLILYFKVDITPVLGASAVAGVAIGFASQTSLSNLISGLFLVLERPFTIGDWIEVDGSFGAVHNIELLSTYIRTVDNKMVRIPNEMLAKSKLVNFTRYPVRRVDLDISISCREDVARVMRLFREVIAANPACFNEPEPLIALKGFGQNSVEFLVAVWVDRKEFLASRTSLVKDIKERFDREGVELPYQRVFLKGNGEQAIMRNEE